MNIIQVLFLILQEAKVYIIRLSILWRWVMSKEALIIAILIALIILWFTETLGMQKTSRILAGAIDLGFAVLR